MDIDAIEKINNSNDTRERSHSSSKHSSRSVSISSSNMETLYHERIVIEDNNSVETKEPINCSQLSYKNHSQVENQVSGASDDTFNNGLFCVSNEEPALNNPNHSYIDDDNDVINISIPYDPDQPMEPKLWDGNFHTVSLHGSLEHLSSDAINIKKSLVRIAKYIKNKKINSSKANDIKDFEGIGQATWMFLSAIYESKWDFLFADDHKTSFRKKVSHQFTLKVFPMKNVKKGENNTDKLASIQKLLLPIPTKSFKEVNKISKFFGPQRLN